VPVVDPAVAALAFPAVMLSLMGLVFTAAAVRGREALDAMSRRGSVIYLTILVVYTIAALILTRASPEQLGLVPDGDAAAWVLRTVAFTLIGGLAAWGLLLAELELALRLRRGSAASSAPLGAGDERARVATAGRLFAVQALAFAIAEELLWRGIGVREVQAEYGAGTEAIVIAAGVVLFGACHVYFGLRAVLTKSFCGAVWTGLTLVALGVIPALVSHAVYQVLVHRWNRARARRTATAGHPVPRTVAS
jgi:membrane protease YdiL (CAAX protease family)